MCISVLLTNWVNCSAGSEEDDDEGLDPAVKVVKEKERRQANNARERCALSSFYYFDFFPILIF